MLQILPTAQWRHCALPALLLLTGGMAGAQPLPEVKTQDAPARDEVRVSGGVRLWSAKWDSWNVNPVTTGVAVGANRYEVVESMQGDEKLAVIPFVSLRYGSWFVSASTMAKTAYQLNDSATPGSLNVDSSRAEIDANLGYQFAPGVSASLGNKQIRQRFGTDHYKWSGPVVALNANAPLSSGWGLYTTVGLGQLKGRFPKADVNGQTRFDTNYRLMEGGLTYSVTPPAEWVRSLVLTVGYRSQRMATKHYALASTPAVGQPTQNATSDLVDITQGLVLGLQGTF